MGNIDLAGFWGDGNGLEKNSEIYFEQHFSENVKLQGTKFGITCSFNKVHDGIEKEINSDENIFNLLFSTCGGEFMIKFFLKIK